MNKEKVYEEVFASVPSEDFDPATLEIEWHNPFDEDKVTILNNGLWISTNPNLLIASFIFLLSIDNSYASFKDIKPANGNSNV